MYSKALQKSFLASQHNTCVIDVEIGHMIQNVSVCPILIAAFLILSCGIVANLSSLLLGSLIENLSVHMKEAPIFERKMRNWVFMMSNSGFKVIFSIYFIEPYCKFGITNSWAS